MRDNRTYGSEGGAAQINESSLPLSGGPAHQSAWYAEFLTERTVSKSTAEEFTAGLYRQPQPRQGASRHGSLRNRQLVRTGTSATAGTVVHVGAVPLHLLMC